MSSVTSFTDLGLPAPLLRVLTERGITTPTPIQEATLADALAGRDVLGRGRTGSGKTYAFLLPLVARLAAAPQARKPRRPRALILAPTRELVRQIETALEPLAATAGLTSITVFGGVSDRPQVAALRSGVDVVVACPGRLEDLIRNQSCSLADIEVTILDEADHMADLGFLPAVTRLLGQTPARGQRLLFSATLDSAVAGLVRRFLHDPAKHEADSAEEAAPLLAHHVLHVPDGQHFSVLSELAAAPGRTVVFTRTKRRAKTITRQLNAMGVAAVELHANLSQNARARSLDSFQSSKVTTMVATDIAARGIHVDDVSLVVHADPPVDPKAYTHRSGRTARAGKAGTVVTLTTDAQLNDVRKLARAAGVSPKMTRVESTRHPILTELAPGERVFGAPILPVENAQPQQQPRRRSGGAGRGASTGSGTKAHGSTSRGPKASGPKAAGPKAGGPSAPSRQRKAAPRTANASSNGDHSAANFSSRRRRSA